MVFLRTKTSSQKLTKAWRNLDSLGIDDLADHAAAYKFGTNKKATCVRPPDGSAIEDPRERSR